MAFKDSDDNRCHWLAQLRRQRFGAIGHWQAEHRGQRLGAEPLEGVASLAGLQRPHLDGQGLLVLSLDVGVGTICGLVGLITFR